MFQSGNGSTTKTECRGLDVPQRMHVVLPGGWSCFQISIWECWRYTCGMERQDSIELVIRRIGPEDSIAELTQLLHRAYAGLAARGMRFVATYQDEATTLDRISDGECHLAIQDGRMIGTITWYDPQHCGGSPWYDRPDVASFGQFGVEPVWQGRGIGERLLAVVEQRAAVTGAAELALDTAESAHDLIRFYTNRGFRRIETAQWKHANYRSVIMSKRVGPPEGTTKII